MTERRFTCEDQERFARLSGDYNPIHVDPVEARRRIFGRQVVHGIHLLLWALDCLVKSSGSDGSALISLHVFFRKPVPVGDTVSLTVNHQKENFKLEFWLEEGVVANVIGNWEQIPGQAHGLASQLAARDDFPEFTECRTWEADQLLQASGVIEMCLSTVAFSELFPNLSRLSWEPECAAILATTRLVGTVCPGQYSAYSELSLNFDRDRRHINESFVYEATDWVDSLGALTLELSGGFGGGYLKALHYESPYVQITSDGLKGLVQDREFRGLRALIIGGSRGLGELAAKILAAGGASICITYYLGEGDAQRVVDEIAATGGDAKKKNLNVLSYNDATQASLAAFNPTHLFYFSTPNIEGHSGRYAPKLFAKFCDYYVNGFIEIVQSFKNSCLAGVFYPSTVYLDTLPINFGEYVAAKKAGEIFCELFASSRPDLAVYFPRLPKLSSDQTIGPFSADRQDPTPVMLEHIREFCRRSVV